jgi:hypothetical protein
VNQDPDPSLLMNRYSKPKTSFLKQKVQKILLTNAIHFFVRVCYACKKPPAFHRELPTVKNIKKTYYILCRPFFCPPGYPGAQRWVKYGYLSLSTK